MFFLKKKSQDEQNNNSQISPTVVNISVPEPEQSLKTKSAINDVSKKLKNKKSKVEDPLEQSFDNYAKDSASIETTESVFKNIAQEVSQVEKEIKETQKNLDFINAELEKLEKSRR